MRHRGWATVPNTETNKTVGHGYGGRRALVLAQSDTEGEDHEEYKTDALGNRFWVRDNTMVGGIDRTRQPAPVGRQHNQRRRL